MTPLIDVTFQLIIFFMLVNNIIAEENVDMLVPNLEQPRTRELGEVDKVTINVAPQEYDRTDRTSGNPLNFPGDAMFVQIGQEKYGIDQLGQMVESLKQSKAANSEVEVLLRADAALYYKSIQPVMDAINSAGISTVNLVAVIPDENRGEDSGGGGPGETTE